MMHLKKILKPLGSKIFIFLCFVFIILLSSSYLIADPIIVTNLFLNQKTIKTGKELSGYVEIGNKGDQVLHIRGVQTSCGCTTLRLKTRRIKPREKVRLDFFVDTRGKLGMVEKSIKLHSNDLNSPHNITFSFHALAEGMEGTDTQAIFEPPCSSCHLDPAVGKYSSELFTLACSICHENGINSSDKFALENWIVKGNKKVGMPSFQEHLSKQQINSLISILINE